MGRSGTRTFRYLAGVVALTLMGGLLPTLPAAASTAAPAQSQEADQPSREERLAAEHARAADRAAMTGKPVRVQSLTTEHDEVVALPRGGFERRSRVEPVRTKKDGAWREIDTTLTVRSDGTVAPKVASVDLALSGGGNALPLARIAHDGVDVALGWDAKFWGKSLPKPDLDGDTARYRDVLDGVDLEIKVAATGFRQVLVVKNAEAARSPKLKKLHFGQKVKGGQVKKEARTGQKAEASKPAPSTLEVVDGGGDVVFVGNASQMWDSSGKVADKFREATVAEDDDKQAVMGVDVDSDSVEITPDQEFLSDSDTEYPVYIDPNYICTTCDSRDDYLVVYQKAGSVGDTSWNNDDENLLKVGHVDDVSARSYFDFDISDVPSTANISSANLHLTVNNSYYPDCRGTTYVYATSYIYSSMYWGNEPSKGDYIGVINSSNRPSNETECVGDWQRTSTVTPVVQSLRDGGKGQATFGLYASTYSSTTDWRRFRTNPGLTIRYWLPPRPPTSVTTFNGTVSVGCSGSSTSPTWVGAGYVELAAKMSNPSLPSGASYVGESGLVSAKFAYRRTGATSWNYHTTAPKSSGTSHRLRLSSTFAVDGPFEWMVKAEDENGHGSAFVGSAEGKPCYVTVDRVAPSTPVVNSTDYPSADETDPASGGVGKTGWFTITPGAATGWQGTNDVKCYHWALVPDTATKCNTTADSNGKATIAITPEKEGRHVLYVKAFDKAGNPSFTPREYSFKVASGGGPISSWELEDNGNDSIGTKPLALNNASFGEGHAKRGQIGRAHV